MDKFCPVCGTRAVRQERLGADDLYVCPHHGRIERLVPTRTTTPGESNGEWSKIVHKCDLPEVPQDMEVGSEWTCSCGRVWVLSQSGLIVKPEPRAYIWNNPGWNPGYPNITYGSST